MKKLIASLLAALGFGAPAPAAAAEREGGDPVSRGLREQVFALKPGEVGVDPRMHPLRVWGMVMETGLDSGFYTLVVLADGTTSLYLSTGGGVIGAGEKEAVRVEAARFLTLADASLAAATPAQAHPAPAAGQTIFYFLSNEGLKSYSAKELDLGEQRDQLSALFLQAHAVIARIRESSGQ